MNRFNIAVLSLVLLLAATGCTPKPTASEPQTQPGSTTLLPTLQNATVRFVFAKGDNKNKDTHLALAITKQSLAIARNDDFGGDQEFGDPGNYGPFNLIVQPGITKEQYRGSTTRLTIAPSGQDRVIMNVIVDARFSDGETISTESGIRTVDQDNRILEFPNL